MALPLLSALFLAGCGVCGPPPQETVTVRWSDGDSGTLVDPEGWELKFRLKGVDAPETDGRRARCEAERLAGEASAQAARELTSGQRLNITARYGSDSTGRRELVDLDIGGVDVTSTLIASGHARSWDYDSGESKPDWCP